LLLLMPPGPEPQKNDPVARAISVHQNYSWVQLVSWK
jgi:hypothetical protein